MDYKMSDTLYNWEVLDSEGTVLATYCNKSLARQHVEAGGSYGYTMRQGDLREPPEEPDDG